ncbi:hypothetical protein [Klebsiella pneumoniae]|uniref:hypothetical protein n=1 Tax=Klebsiella/Raoultella group TaxID=2890311 RepID=UPI0012DD6EAB|nr:hypothetical protein [Klebsiella pneumoniae]
MISRKELFAEISNEAVTEDGEVVGYFVKNSRMNLLEQMLCSTVTVKLSKDHVDEADLFGWGVIVVSLDALKEACADAGVSVEITAAGGKVEAE